MSSGQKDNFARGIAILSLLVALASVIVPYVQQENLYEKQQQESLSLILNPSVNGPLILTEHNFGEMGFVIQMPWNLTISNTGNRQLSIIKKRVSSGETPDALIYTGIDGGIVSNEYTPVQLPIKLEAGESKSYYQYVGTMVPQSVYEILKKINGGNPVTDRNAMKALGAKGIDLYGNKVDYCPYEDGKFSITFEESNKAPKHWVALGTGAGNIFFASASKYGLVQ